MIIEELQLPIQDLIHHLDCEDLEYGVLVFKNDHLVLLYVSERSDLISHVHKTTHNK